MITLPHASLSISWETDLQPVESLGQGFSIETGRRRALGIKFDSVDLRYQPAERDDICGEY